jgi:hypothetical protein
LIERYQRAQGRWPDELAEVAVALKLAIPKDPFTGKDLSYHKTDEGYIVYSVGRAGEDLGGEGFNNESGNVGVRVSTVDRPTGSP